MAKARKESQFKKIHKRICKICDTEFTTPWIKRTSCEKCSPPARAYYQSVCTQCANKFWDTHRDAIVCHRCRPPKIKIPKKGKTVCHWCGRLFEFMSPNPGMRKLCDACNKVDYCPSKDNVQETPVRRDYRRHPIRRIHLINWQDCLRCSKAFDSTGPGNRICPLCLIKRDQEASEYQVVL